MMIYDPEFPLIDIWTMGLIYHIEIVEAGQVVVVTMTLTTPACPAADYITQSVVNAIEDAYDGWECSVVMTFDPMWTIDCIKDEDFKKLFC